MNLDQYKKKLNKLIQKKTNYTNKIDIQIQELYSRINIINSLFIQKDGDRNIIYKYKICYINKNISMNRASTSYKNLIFEIFNIAHDKYAHTFREVFEYYCNHVKLQILELNGDIIDNEIVFKKKQDAQAMITRLESMYVLNTLSEKT